MPAHAPMSPAQQRRTAQVNDLLPLGDWYRHHSLRSWPVLLFLVLICVPTIALVSGILFLGYAKVGSRADQHLTAARAPAFMLPHAPAAEHAARSGRPPWWEH